MLLSTPWTSHPRASKKVAASEPMSPLLPVMTTRFIAVRRLSSAGRSRRRAFGARHGAPGTGVRWARLIRFGSNQQARRARLWDRTRNEVYCGAPNGHNRRGYPRSAISGSASQSVGLWSPRPAGVQQRKQQVARLRRASEERPGSGVFHEVPVLRVEVRHGVLRSEEHGRDTPLEERPPGFRWLDRRVEEASHLGTPGGHELIGRALERRMRVRVVAEDAGARGNHPAEDRRQSRLEVGEYLPLQRDLRQPGDWYGVQLHRKREGVHQHPR